ncbi:MAG: amidase [Sphingopyxis sp.]|nr:amidase [Sphingopyxis sp.]
MITLPLRCALSALFVISNVVPAARAMAQDRAEDSANVPPLLPPTAPPADHNRLIGMSIAEMLAGMEAGTLSSVQIVRWSMERMAALDDNGPRVNAVARLYNDALTIAAQRDAERAAGRIMGPLHGIPILLKDNIEAAGTLPTTAGSLALANNVNGRDAPLVARLRAAGAVILGRTNLSEWANFRDENSTSGWSAMWGLTRNPHSLDRSACGSSSGSGAAVAAGFAAVAIGTETDGSIVCPAGINGVVGFKPTLGLVSRRYIVPISTNQDTAGPMTLTVADAALILSVIAGSDPADPATAQADARRQDYVAATQYAAVPRGLRIGVLRDAVGDDAAINAQFDAALAHLTARGATLVDIRNDGIDRRAIGEAEYAILLADFRAEIDAYLATRPSRASGDPASLSDLMLFNQNRPEELRFFGQSIFAEAMAAAPVGSDAYRTALATAKRLAGAEGIDRLLREHQVDVLVAVTNGPSWAIDLIHGDRFAGPSASQLPAVAGYPHLTVPMGMIHGLPVGLSIIGTAWDDARVLAVGQAFQNGRSIGRAGFYADAANAVPAQGE